MRLMEEKILSEGKVLPGEILKVGNFLNQMIDTGFLREMGKEISRLYKNGNVTKVLTVEASGIAIAAAVGMEMGIPMVFAKKRKSANVDGALYVSKVHSYTQNKEYDIEINTDYILPTDRVLLVDDFLANGNALKGMIDLVRQSGAELVGAAIAIEKGFQGGGDELRAAGIRVESLAIVEHMDSDSITFRS